MVFLPNVCVRLLHLCVCVCFPPCRCVSVSRMGGSSSPGCRGRLRVIEAAVIKTVLIVLIGVIKAARVRLLTHTDTHRHTQTHTDTHRHAQTRTDTHRPAQTHTDTHSPINMYCVCAEWKFKLPHTVIGRSISFM